MAQAQRRREPELAAKTAQEFVSESFGRFETAITETIQEELTYLNRHKSELSRELSAAWNEWADRVGLSPDSSQAQWERAWNSFREYKYEVEPGSLEYDPNHRGGNQIVWEYAKENNLAFFYSFGSFELYLEEGTDVSIFPSAGYRRLNPNCAEPEISTQEITNLYDEMREQAEFIISEGLPTTGERGERSETPPLRARDFYDITMQKFVELFNSSVGYAGDSASPVSASSVPSGRIPVIMTEDGRLSWSNGVSVAEATF